MRVNRVEKARKDAGRCGKCGDPIPAGSGYRWIKGRYSGRKVRCLKPGCAFSRADMTSSDKLARLYDAEDSLEAALQDFETLSDLESAFEDAASTAREVGDEYRESANNIESGFNARTSMCDELEEKADACDAWADEVESVLSEAGEWDEDEAFEEALQTWLDEADPEDKRISVDEDGERRTDPEDESVRDEVQQIVDEKHEEWRESIRDAFSGVSMEL